MLLFLIEDILCARSSVEIFLDLLLTLCLHGFCLNL